jgi:D-alanyl-D-alanine carboxypeptidase
MERGPQRDSAWRRRAFLGMVSVLGVAAVALTLLRPTDRSPTPGPATASDNPGGATAGSGVAVAAPNAPEPATVEPPPYFLAWTPGGLPLDFRARVRTVPGIGSTVVVAGDTRWLTRSLDAGGDVIDDPRAPFAIPIDAFAVNSVEVAPFLPAGVRGDVVDALARGQGVLGTRSAVVRRLGVGGTLEFGERSVRIGAVVPEELIGWSELLVSREVGTRLGIVDDRYLWAFLDEERSLGSFEQLIRPLVPENEPLRVEGPGDSPYMRVANGVNPPVVLKQAFGEFAAALDPSNPASFRIEPAWIDANLATRSVPLLGRLTCHRRFMEDLVRAMRRVEREGLGSLIHSTAGCFNARTVARSPTNPPSFHAYGAAVDINAPENALGAEPTMDPRVVAIFEDLGFNWGGDFLIPDGMHFEYGGGPLAGDP